VLDIPTFSKELASRVREDLFDSVAFGLAVDGLLTGEIDRDRFLDMLSLKIDHIRRAQIKDDLENKGAGKYE
jgi:hypothetical protein